jgi:hypothetical protein
MELSGRSFSFAICPILLQRFGRRSRNPSISANGLRSILSGASVPLALRSSRQWERRRHTYPRHTVKRADAPRALEYNWGGGDIRWELEPLGSGGTRLTLWHNIDRGFISMGAAGWHVCFDVLDRLLAGQPIGRIVGPEAMKFSGWQRLNAEYAKQFDVEPPNLSSRSRT